MNSQEFLKLILAKEISSDASLWFKETVRITPLEFKISFLDPYFDQSKNLTNLKLPSLFEEFESQDTDASCLNLSCLDSHDRADLFLFNNDAKKTVVR